MRRQGSAGVCAAPRYRCWCSSTLGVHRGVLTVLNTSVQSTNQVSFSCPLSIPKRCVCRQGKLGGGRRRKSLAAPTHFLLCTRCQAQRGGTGCPAGTMQVGQSTCTAAVYLQATLNSKTRHASGKKSTRPSPNHNKKKTTHLQNRGGRCVGGRATE